MKIGVISDTHGHLDPRLRSAFPGVEAIIHAGDVGAESVLLALRDIAPVYAVCGNNDEPLSCLGLPQVLDLELAGVRIRVVHQVRDLGQTDSVHVAVFGHSHRQLCEVRGGVLHLNPGAAGRVGFHALQTVALLHLDAGVATAELLTLGPRLKPVRS
jgi:putative phosphoesterase